MSLIRSSEKMRNAPEFKRVYFVGESWWTQPVVVIMIKPRHNCDKMFFNDSFNQRKARPRNDNKLLPISTLACAWAGVSSSLTWTASVTMVFDLSKAVSISTVIIPFKEATSSAVNPLFSRLAFSKIGCDWIWIVVVQRCISCETLAVCVATEPEGQLGGSSISPRLLKGCELENSWGIRTSAQLVDTEK